VGLDASSFGEGNLGALDPVERRVTQRLDDDLIARGIEAGSAHRAGLRLPRTGYFERPLPFD